MTSDSHATAPQIAQDTETLIRELPSYASSSLEALRRLREGADRACSLAADLASVRAQLDAVDKALGQWEPEPGSEVGCVGRVQTILNLKADRAQLDEALAERDSYAAQYDEAVQEAAAARAHLYQAREALVAAAIVISPLQYPKVASKVTATINRTALAAADPASVPAEREGER